MKRALEEAHRIVHGLVDQSLELKISGVLQMVQPKKSIEMRNVCHARSGDKGNTANVGLICYNMNDYDWLKRHATPDRVKEYLGDSVKGEVERFELPNIGALNFVLHAALDGGASRSLRLDIHGKGYSSIMLSWSLETEELPPSLNANANANA